MSTIRPGEIPSPLDPAREPGDAALVFIGKARTPWTSRDDCPKNLREARERGGGARLEIDHAWRAGLRDLAAGEAIVVLTWLDRARRDLLVQAPRHQETTAGVFSIRSPVRPNPIGLHIVRLVSIDAQAGTLEVDALDCLDRTPILDLKPWRQGVDVPPDPPLSVNLSLAGRLDILKVEAEKIQSLGGFDTDSEGRSSSPMGTYSGAVRNDVDSIRQLEVDLKQVAADPLRFPRTTKLKAAGAPQQAKKMVEEAAELAIEAVRHDRSAAVMEAADLVYNMVVLLEGMNIRFDEVCGELDRRRGLYGIAAKQQKNGAPEAA